MNPDVFRTVNVPDRLKPYFRRALVADLNAPINMSITIRGTGYCYLGWTPSGRWTGTVNSNLVFDTGVQGPIHLSGQVFDSDVVCKFTDVTRQIFLEFTATGQFEFFGIPGIDTYEFVLSGDDIGPKFALLAGSGFKAASDIPLHDAFFSMLEKYAAAARHVPRHVRTLVDRLELSEGSEPLNEIFGILDVSERKARDDFSRIVGLSPKRFAKLIQINATLGELLGMEEKLLSSLAQTAGYFDQAHMTRDFVKFLGNSPIRVSKDIEPTLRRFVGRSRKDAKSR